jgi:hypothetical protein
MNLRPAFAKTAEDGAASFYTLPAMAGHLPKTEHSPISPGASPKSRDQRFTVLPLGSLILGAAENSCSGEVMGVIEVKATEK